MSERHVEEGSKRGIPVTADDESVVGKLLEGIANVVVDRATLENGRGAVHAAMDEVRAVRVTVVNRDRLVRAGQVGEDVREAERAAAGEDDRLDRMVERD